MSPDAPMNNHGGRGPQQQQQRGRKKYARTVSKFMIFVVVVLLVWSIIPIWLYHSHIILQQSQGAQDGAEGHKARIRLPSMEQFKQNRQPPTTRTATAQILSSFSNEGSVTTTIDQTFSKENNWWWDMPGNEQIPRRFFAKQDGSFFYPEPPAASKNGGAFADVSRFPYVIKELTPLTNPYDDHLEDNIRTTMKHRLQLLQESDRFFDLQQDGSSSTSLPKYLPPEFPQRNRFILEQMTHPSTITGIPPSCCPNEKLQEWTKDNFSYKRIKEKGKEDCSCVVGENYHSSKDNNNDTPLFQTTIVTAFYSMKSKHRPDTYKRYFAQIGATSDPMIVFADKENTPQWFQFFVEARSHAPTVVVPLRMEDLSCASTLPLEDFWRLRQSQYDLERFGTGKNENLHKDVSMALYAVWCEKLVFVQAATILNPFNTTGFAWVDAGFARTAFPHLYRQPIWNPKNDILQRESIDSGIPHSDPSYRPPKGISDHSVLLFHMRPYFNNPFDETRVWNPHLPPSKMLINGGNCYAGSLWGYHHLYSAYYETLWSMFTSSVFAGEDQCTMYRACHFYPKACHIHLPKLGLKKWMVPLQNTLTASNTTHEKFVGYDWVVEQRRTKLVALSKPRIPNLITPPFIANDTALKAIGL